MTTEQRMMDYLKSTIRDKEKELVRLEAEVSALRGMYSSFQTIQADMARREQEALCQKNQ